MTEAAIALKENYAVGQTVDISLNLSASPFTDESQIAFFEAFKKKVDDSEIETQGTCEMYCTLVQKESDRTKALGVDGALDFSYGPVSGDANVQFTMNNIQGSLELTMIVRAKQYGRLIKNDLPEIVKLKLRNSVLDKIKNDENYTIEQFKKEYGSYLIYGYDYGGEIRFQSKYSTNSSQDKMSVGGGLSVSYKEMGFNVEGSVKGSYSSDDISRSTDIETEYKIKPSYDTELINGEDGIIPLLIKISDPSSNGINANDDTKNDDSDSVGEISSVLFRKMQQLLGGDKLDPVKSIIYPIERIGCIADVFTAISASEHVTDFFAAMNPIYQLLKEKLKGLETMNKNYDSYSDPDDKPQEMINLYFYALNANISKMEIIKDDRLDEYTEKWYNYTINRNTKNEEEEDEEEDKEEDKEREYEVQKDFYKINKEQLEKEFDIDLFNAYNDMMTKKPQEQKKEDIKFDANTKFDAISLKGSNGQYVCAEPDGKHRVYCNSDTVTELAKFTSIPRENGKIALKSNVTQKYVHMKDGKLYANSDKITSRDKFKVHYTDDGKFGLKCHFKTHRFLTVQSDGVLKCSGHTLEKSQQFEIAIINQFNANTTFNAISLKANNGKYVSADNNGMYCNSDDQSETCTFKSIAQGNDKITLYIADEKIISVTKDGEVKAVNTDGQVKEEEKFKIIDLDNGKFGLKSYYDTYLSARKDFSLKCDQTEFNASEQFEITIIDNKQ